jgi:predicted dehydrogenase
MLGMIEGNGHPYSWSAIVNGFDPEAMTRCPYPVIPRYLGAQPRDSVRVPGVQVTHIWTDNPAEAPGVAAAALIPNVVAQPADVIGHVDAVLIATDDGFDHVRRAEPFVKAGLPVFIDKPLALTIPDLRTFIGWQRAGARLQSSSGLRYAAELDPLLKDTGVGELRWVAGTTCKTWERYGIHLLEPVFRLLGPGFESVRLESHPGSKTEVAHLLHRSGAQYTLSVMYDGGPAHGLLALCGTSGAQTLRFTDTYTAFRRQMLSFIDFVRTGSSQYPFAETIELMCVLIAGIRSRAEKSRRVAIAEIQNELAS